MVHEAMVLEYSGRHLAVIELAAALEAAALYLADRLHLFSVGPGAARQRPRGLCDRRRQLRRASLRPAAFLLALFETSIAKMRVFRVPEFLGRGAHARPPRHAAAVRLAELLMGTSRPSTSPICWPAAWCSSASCCSTRIACSGCSTSLRCTPSCCRCRSPGRPISRTRRISTSRPAIALVLKAHHHSGRAAPRRRAARHPPHDRDRRRHRPDHAARHRARRPVDGRHAAGDRRPPIRWRARIWRSRCPSCCSGS